MLIILNLFLVIYALFLAFIVLKTLLLQYNYLKLQRRILWISDLGKYKNNGFNPAISLFGLLSLSIGVNYYFKLPCANDVFLQSLLLVGISISTALVGVFPKNKFQLIHEIIGGLILCLLIVFSASTLLSEETRRILPQYLNILNGLIIVFSPLVMIGSLFEYLKFRSKLIVIGARFEWIVVLFALVWNIVMALFLLSINL